MYAASPSTAHDFAAAGFRERIDEADVIGLCQGADFFYYPFFQ
jgi:hypothetical protein